MVGKTRSYEHPSFPQAGQSQQPESDMVVIPQSGQGSPALTTLQAFGSAERTGGASSVSFSVATSDSLTNNCSNMDAFVLLYI